MYTNKAKFTINSLPSVDDNGDSGVNVTAGQTLTIALEANPALGVSSVEFSINDPNDIETPLCSLNSTPQVFEENGEAIIRLSAPNTPVTIIVNAATEISSYIIRAKATTIEGVYVYERLIAVREEGLRMTVAGETTQFGRYGWNDALNELTLAILNGGGGGGGGWTLVSASADGAANSFPSGLRRIFHSDGSVTGGTWAQLTSADVTSAFADASIGTGKLNAGGGSEGQVLKIVGGVATFANESVSAATVPVSTSVVGTVNSFPTGQKRILHSDGATDGGVWSQLSLADVNSAFAAGAIGPGILAPGTAGQVLTTSGGGATVWATPATTSLVSSSAAGTSNSFPAGQRRILHSDGSAAGGSWAQLSSADVNGAFAAGAIGPTILAPGSAGQVLTTSGGVVVWAAPATTSLVSSSAAGTSNAFPAGQRRILHSDGSAAGGSWAQLSQADVSGAFAAGAIGPGIITPGTAGQVLTTSGGAAVWAGIPATPSVSSAVAGIVSTFPAGQRRILHSDGSAAGGTWAQLSEADVTGSFAPGAIATPIVKPGANGQVLTTTGGAAAWANPAPLTIAGATQGDMLSYTSGAWNRLPISAEPNAPLMSIGGVPAWAALNGGPSVLLPPGVLDAPVVSMVGFGDARAVVVDLTGPTTLRSITPAGWRPGYYLFQNLSVHTLTVRHVDPLATGSVFYIHGEQDIQVPPDHYFMVFFDGAYLAITDTSNQFLGPGDHGDILYRNASGWTQLPAGTAGQSLITGGPSANPSWGNPLGSTLVLKPGDSSGTPRTYGTWTTAWAAAIGYGGPVTILIEDGGTDLLIPSGTYDGDARVSIFFANRTSGHSLTVTFANGAEIRNINAWACLAPWPFSINAINVLLLGTSTNECAILNTSMRGNEFLYSGQFFWVKDVSSSRTAAIRFSSDCAVRLREVIHGGNIGLKSVGSARVIAERNVSITPAIESDTSGSLTIHQHAGTRFEPSWSGTITRETIDQVSALSYTPATPSHWVEGSPAHPADALDKLAARTLGALPPGSQLFHGNYWFSFGKNSEGLNINPFADSMSIWVPRFNHWLLIGMNTTNSDTDHREMYVGVGRNFRRMNQQGWWNFDPSISSSISSNFARPFSAYVIPNGGGVRIVVSSALVSAGTQCVATSDDGGVSWTLRTGPFGSSTSGMRNFCWSGTHLIGVRTSQSTAIGRSANGSSWSSATLTANHSWLKCVSNGAGLVVAFRDGNTCQVSSDHGATWAAATITGWSASFFDAIYYNGQFIVLDNAGTVFRSTNGTTWTPSALGISNPGKTNYSPIGWNYRSLVKCGGVLACQFKGTYAAQTLSEIFYSYDGITWSDGGVMDGVYSATYETASSRFASHFSSSTPNSPADVQSNVHQVVGRILGMGFDDFDTGSYWAASPAIMAPPS